MFNGIIYNQGIITKIIKRPKGLNIFVKSNLKVSKKDMGLSVACDGVCLTLISYKSKIMEFYLSKETIIRSKFKFLKIILFTFNFKIDFVKVPVPGPISITVFESGKEYFTILSVIFESNKKFCPNDFLNLKLMGLFFGKKM